MNRRFILITLAMVLLAASGFGVIAARASCRPQPFDAPSWRASDAGSSARFRMASNLLERLNVEQWNYDTTLRTLGTPLLTNTTADVSPIDRLKYMLSRPCRLGIQDYYLLVQFDDKGEFMNAGIHPD